MDWRKKRDTCRALAVKLNEYSGRDVVYTEEMVKVYFHRIQKTTLQLALNGQQEAIDKVVLIVEGKKVKDTIVEVVEEEENLALKQMLDDMKLVLWVFGKIGDVKRASKAFNAVLLQIANDPDLKGKV